MRKPFDDLPTVTELIRLYKEEGKGMEVLAKHFDTTPHNVRYTLELHNIPIRKRAEFQLKEKTIEIPKGTGKYDYLFDEEVNEGKNYAQYSKGMKIPKDFTFKALRKYRTKKTT